MFSVEPWIYWRLISAAMKPFEKLKKELGSVITSLGDDFGATKTECRDFHIACSCSVFYFVVDVV